MVGGAKAGASSMTTRPAGSSTYSVSLGSSGRQSDGFEAASTSGMLGCACDCAAAGKKNDAARSKNLRLRTWELSMHESLTKAVGGRMRRILIELLRRRVGSSRAFFAVWALGYCRAR